MRHGRLLMSGTVEEIIIVGSGPAAHAAAIYTARAELRPLMFEGFMAGGVAAGGQLTTTTEVENYPGFPEGISGPELMQRMREQAEHHGTRIVTETVASVDLRSRPFAVTAGEAVYRCRALVIATGATARRMALPGEERYWQKGISACAVCDGALPLFRNKPLVVVGGGDSACEEASFLSKYGSAVTMVVRRDVLRASRVMQKRVQSSPKIVLSWHTVPVEAVGDKSLTGVRVKDVKTGAERVLEASGLFYAIGHIPNTGFLGGQLETDETGYLVTTPGSAATTVPGVFACGDVQDRRYRQAITAAGSGCMAALEAIHFLEDEAAR
jgi:thioredoxin reductase (NADPH)